MPSLQELLQQIQNNEISELKLSSFSSESSEDFDMDSFVDKMLVNHSFDQLIDALKTNTSVKSVILVDPSNEGIITLELIQQLAEALTQNSTIKTLCIKDSKLGDQLIDALKPGLQQNNSVTYLDVSANKITANGISTLIGIVEQTPNLVNVLAYHNPGRQKCKTRLNKAIIANKKGMIVANRQLETASSYSQIVASTGANASIGSLSSREESLSVSSSSSTPQISDTRTREPAAGNKRSRTLSDNEAAREAEPVKRVKRFA